MPDLLPIRLRITFNTGREMTSSFENASEARRNLLSLAEFISARIEGNGSTGSLVIHEPFTLDSVVRATYKIFEIEH